MNELNNYIKEYVYPRSNEEIELYKKNCELVVQMEKYANLYDAFQYSQCFVPMYVNMHPTIQRIFIDELRRLSGRNVTIRYAMECGIPLEKMQFPGHEFKTFWSIRTSIDFDAEETLVKEPVFLHNGIRSFYITVFSVPMTPDETGDSFIYSDRSKKRCLPRFKFLAYI